MSFICTLNASNQHHEAFICLDQPLSGSICDRSKRQRDHQSNRYVEDPAGRKCKP